MDCIIHFSIEIVKCAIDTDAFRRMSVVLARIVRGPWNMEKNMNLVLGTRRLAGFVRFKAAKGLLKSGFKLLWSEGPQLADWVEIICDVVAALGGPDLTGE